MSATICRALLLLYAVDFSISKEIGPSVLHTISDGGLHGFIKYAKHDYSSPVFTFFGIPYAAPPTGELRFKPPQPVQPWKGIRDATQRPPMCPQNMVLLKSIVDQGLPLELDAPMTEDCLFLDVYTPTLNQKAKLPVMFFIHGGGFTMGSARDTDGSVLASYGNVVSVVINYRLGPLGFLTTYDDEAPGNAGLRDQNMALQWVQNHISSFGGDPSKVTIYGESAGSMSVVTHVMSPMSEGLFARAIAQSGSVANFFVPYAATKGSGKAEYALDALAKCVDCESSNASEVLSCLKEKPGNELHCPSNPMIPWTLSCGDDFFPTCPDDMISQKLPQLKERLAKLDLIMGTTSIEGYMVSSAVCSNFNKEKNSENMEKDIKGMFGMFFSVDDDTWDNHIKSVLWERYLPQENPTEEELVLAVTHLTGGFMLIATTHKTLYQFTELGANAYGYELAQGPSFLKEKRPSYIPVDHGDDIFLGMGASMMEDFKFNTDKFPMDDNDLEIERQMLQYWTNFAKTGDPNGPGLVTWPRYTIDTQEALSISTQSTVKHHYVVEEVEFWTETVPAILKKAKEEAKKEEL